MTNTTYGDISPRTAAYAARDMLSHAEPVIILQKFGLTKEQPRNKTNAVKFRRPVPFSAATVPLVEGVTPSAQQMSYEDVNVTLSQYGKPIQISDVIIDTHEDPVLRDANMLAGEQAALTMEMITYGVIKAGTSVYYANGAARTSVNTPISLNAQRGVTKYLKSQKAKKISAILDGSPNYGTKPVEAAYVAVTHTDVEPDLRNLPGFIPVADYGSRQVLCAEEVGSCEDVRYICSPELSPFEDAGGAKAGSGTTMVSTSGTSADVYPIIYLGKEAFGCVPLKGKSGITPMVVNPKPSSDDPLAQRGFVSWKAYFAALILNQTWMSRLEVAVTDI